MTRSIVDRHVTTDIPDAVEINVEACLAVLATAEAVPGEHERARRRLRQVGGWFEASPEQVAALIDALAGLDPLRRTRRRTALTAAWASLLDL